MSRTKRDTLAKRKRLDAAFAAMADDPEYQEEAILIAEEFAQGDWEALAINEKATLRD